MAPTPLYAALEINKANGQHIYETLRRNGFKDLLDPETYHITTMYSTKPVEYEPHKDVAGTAFLGEIKTLGTYLVLFVDSIQATKCWTDGLAAGASWDHPGYMPHLSISKNTTQPVPNKYLFYQTLLTIEREYTSPLET